MRTLTPKTAPIFVVFLVNYRCTLKPKICVSFLVGFREKFHIQFHFFLSWRREGFSLMINLLGLKMMMFSTGFLSFLRCLRVHHTYDKPVTILFLEVTPQELIKDFLEKKAQFISGFKSLQQSLSFLVPLSDYLFLDPNNPWKNAGF